jgi:hypothetical protein
LGSFHLTHPRRSWLWVRSNRLRSSPNVCEWLTDRNRQPRAAPGDHPSPARRDGSVMLTWSDHIPKHRVEMRVPFLKLAASLLSLATIRVLMRPRAVIQELSESPWLSLPT